MDLTLVAREMHLLEKELAEYEADTKRYIEKLRSEISACAKTLAMSAEGIDADKIALARTVLFVRGEYAYGGEDRKSVIRDAIKQLATGEPIRKLYNDLWRQAFGTKNYDSWRGQRADHDYGYGPGHGSIVFQVGLREDVRKRIPQALTAEEIEAAIYLLVNLERVQSAERSAAP